MEESHIDPRKEVETFTNLSFEERAAIYEDAKKGLALQANIWAVAACKKHAECAGLSAKIKSLEHEPSRKFLEKYTALGGLGRLALSQHAIRSAMRHIFLCVGEEKCEKALNCLLERVLEDPHLDVIFSTIKNEARSGLKPKNVKSFLDDQIQKKEREE